MNQLRGILSSKRILDAIRINSSRQPPITKFDLRFFNSDGNGGRDASGEAASGSVSEEPRPERSFGSARKSAIDSVKDDNSFLAKFKLGAGSAKGEKEAEPPAPEAETPPEDADEIFRKMKENGLIPNAVAMLDGLCQDGLVQEAMKLFGLMREKGTIPEVVVYTAVVEGFVKAEKLDDAVRVFRKMQSNGIVPNAFSYGVLVRGLCKCKKDEAALSFCVEMLEAGHSPNVATFVALLDGACKANGVEEGRAVIGKLREKGFLVNDKAVREFLEKKAVFLRGVWEAIFGKRAPQAKPF